MHEEFYCFRQMRYIRIAIILILCLCAGSESHAHSDSSALLHFYLGKGLPANNVYSFITDKQGYQWFATDNGVVKYNGSTFKVFNTNDGLPVSDVFHLFEDTMGRIWLHSFASTVGYIRNDKYTSIKYNFSEKYTNPYDIHQVGDKIVFSYGITSGVGIAMITPEDKLIRFNIGMPLFALYRSVEQEHYLHRVSDGQLCKVTVKNNRFQLKPVFRFSLSAELLSVNRAFIARNKIFFYQFKGNSILLGTLGNKDTSIRKFQKKLNLVDLGGKPDEFIYLIFPYSDSMEVITNNNIYRLNYNLELINKIPTSSFLPSNVQVSFFGNDVFNNQWFTSNQGVWMRPQTAMEFQRHPYSSLLVNAVPAGVLKDSTQCYTDTKSGLFYCIDAAGKILKPDIGNIREVRYAKGDNIKNMMFASLHRFNVIENGVLKDLIPYNKSLIHVTAAHGYPKYIPSKKVDGQMTLADSVKRYMVQSVASFHDYAPGKYLLVGQTDVSTLEVSDTSVVNKQLIYEKFTNYTYDGLNNKYWIYNRYKIICLDPVTEEKVSFNEEMLKKIGIRAVYGIAIDSFQNIYILTDKRLLIYNNIQRAFKVVKTNVNLTVCKILVHNKSLILYGNFGVAVAKIIGPHYVGDFHYVYNPQCQFYNAVNYAQVAPSSTLVLGTDNGVFSVKLDSVLTNSKLNIGNGDSIMSLLLNVPYAREIHDGDTLQFGSDITEFGIDIINFFGKGDRRYYYKIKKESIWQEAQSGIISWKELKAGKYYEVECFAVDDLWKTRLYRFYIYKTPYWWQTTTWKIVFWIGGIALVVSLLALTILLTRHYVSSANEKKSNLLDLELRAVYSQINPHFIFNALSTALFFINKKRFEEAYLHVSKFSRLLRSYLKSSQERYVTLSEEISMLRTYIELQQTRFEEKFDYAIKVENKIPADNVRIPSLLIQPLVENAIIHGLFHKQGKGFLNVQFLQGASSTELICIIEDDGVGRIRVSEIKKESVAKYDSYGTKLTQQLIEIFKEYESMHIYLEYIDKEKPHTGTIAKLTIRNLKYEA